MQWQSVPYRTNAEDCFADTSKGRYLIRCVGRRRMRQYVLRLNGNLLHSFTGACLEDAQGYAEGHYINDGIRVPLNTD